MGRRRLRLLPWLVLVAAVSGCALSTTSGALADDGFEGAGVTLSAGPSGSGVEVEATGHVALPDDAAVPRAAEVVWRTMPIRTDEVDVAVGETYGSFDRDRLTAMFGPRDPALDARSGGSALGTVFAWIGGTALALLIVAGLVVVLLARRSRRRSAARAASPSPGSSRSLTDHLRGIRRPTPGTTVRPAPEVRAALLAAAGPGDWWRVRDGRAEGVDVVVELRFDEPAWSGFFAAQSLGSSALRVRLRLDGGRVRAVTRIHRVHRVGDVWRYGAVERAGSGPDSVDVESSRASTYSRRDGRWQRDFGTDRTELRDRLAAVVTAGGWTWRPASRP